MTIASSRGWSVGRVSESKSHIVTPFNEVARPIGTRPEVSVITLALYDGLHPVSTLSPSPVPYPLCLADGGVVETREAPSFEGLLSFLAEGAPFLPPFWRTGLRFLLAPFSEAFPPFNHVETWQDFNRTSENMS